MRNKIFSRWIAFALVVAMLSGMAVTAGASTVLGDLNGDSKVTVFDAQLLLEAQAGLRQLSGAEELTLLDVLKVILGGMPGAIDSDGDGIIEIYSASGLQQIANDLTGSYKLMNDIDMAGAAWVPLAKFNGTLDGNGKTISNVNIPYSNAGYNTADPTPINQGFFADTGKDAVIKDLNLRNVTLTADTDSVYIGLLIGSNRGKIENVNVTGTIIDTRQSYEKKTYIGVLAGRVCNPASGVEAGTVMGGTGISITDDAGVKTTTGLCADVKLQIASRDQLNWDGKEYGKVSLVGWATANATVSGLWTETSNDTALMSETIQARRSTVVAYMNAMGTATWTPSENLTYTPQEGGGKTYYANTTYTGLPYNRGNGSLERFESALNPDRTTKDGLGSCIWNETDQYTGFVQLMGNNCSTAVGWAWMRVSPVIVAAVADHGIPYHGGAYIVGTSKMIPTEKNRDIYGVYPVGDWGSFSMIDPETGKRTDAPYDASPAAYSSTGATYTLDVLQNNGADTIFEAYAQAHMGDAVTAYGQTWSDTITDAGHARLIAADPITIRNADGSIDTDKSYIITTEQGASSVSTSTWRVNYRYSYRNLLDDPADSASTGYGRTYLPVTMRALHDEDTRSSYISNYTGGNAVTAPDHGKIYSNYHIISSTVTVRNGNDVIYQNEIFTGISNIASVALDKWQTADLSAHSEAFAAAAEAAGLASGDYTFSVQILTSDGNVHNSVTDKTFNYTAPTAE